MKSKMNNSSCNTNNDSRVKNGTYNTSIDSSSNRDGLKEIGNHGDLRDVTDSSGSRDRINMTSSR